MKGSEKSFISLVSILLFFSIWLQADHLKAKISSTQSGWETITRNSKFIADIEAFYTYSELKNSDSLSGGSIDALLAASWKIKESSFLIMKYDGGYEKKLDFYSDDIGQRERFEYQEHSFTPMLRLGLGTGSRVSVIPSFFYTESFNKDSKSAGWSKGLYNYNDFGAGIDFEIGKSGFGRGRGSLMFGIQYYKRHYPNFSSLLDLAAENDVIGPYTDLDTEKDEKNYGGILTLIEYLWGSNEGLSWSSEYSYFYKLLDDKKVVDGNGKLTHEKQQDHLHCLNFRLSYFLTENLKAGISFGGSLNRSNQNFYDGMGTYSYLDDVPVPNYYDYNAYDIQPEIMYFFDRFPVAITLSYSFHKTVYGYRKAKNNAGFYTGNNQWETMRKFFLGLEYTISKNWNLAANWNHIISESNNDDESFYMYDYTLNTYALGASYKF